MARPVYYIESNDPKFLDKQERFFNAGFKIVIIEEDKYGNETDLEEGLYKILCNHLH